jgi:hypothetical protein
MSTGKRSETLDFRCADCRFALKHFTDIVDNSASTVRIGQNV